MFKKNFQNGKKTFTFTQYSFRFLILDYTMEDINSIAETLQNNRTSASPGANCTNGELKNSTHENTTEFSLKCSTSIQESQFLKDNILFIIAIVMIVILILLVFE